MSAGDVSIAPFFSEDPLFCGLAIATARTTRSRPFLFKRTAAIGQLQDNGYVLVLQTTLLYRHRRKGQNVSISAHRGEVCSIWSVILGTGALCRSTSTNWTPAEWPGDRWQRRMSRLACHHQLGFRALDAIGFESSSNRSSSSLVMLGSSVDARLQTSPTSMTCVWAIRTPPTSRTVSTTCVFVNGRTKISRRGPERGPSAAWAWRSGRSRRASSRRVGCKRVPTHCR